MCRDACIIRQIPGQLQLISKSMTQTEGHAFHCELSLTPNQILPPRPRQRCQFY